MLLLLLVELKEKVRGVIIRARARWYEHGEKSSKYFLNLEKRNQVKKHIRKLQINDYLTSNPSAILWEAKRFYMNLYQSGVKDADRDSLIDDFLNNLELPKLSDNEKQSCEGNISLEECEITLNSFKENKSPGSDGIPIEFYKRFWEVIKKPFIECVNESFEKGELSNTQKKAVITLIEKRGKDRCFIENWRPISLLNVDAKIMSKVIAARVKDVLPNIIHSNQTGYVKDRYIGETVRSLLDIMEFTDIENIPGLLIFIDFQKAFDSLEWDFLVLNVLKLSTLDRISFIGSSFSIRTFKAVWLIMVLPRIISHLNVVSGKGIHSPRIFSL